MGGEQRLHDSSLHADAAAVDQPDFPEAARVRRAKILVDDGRDVARGKRVEVERVLDRDGNGFVRVVGQSCTPPVTCSCQCWKLRRSSPESLHCQNVAARSKNGTSTTPTPSARAVSATFCVTI